MLDRHVRRGLDRAYGLMVRGFVVFSANQITLVGVLLIPIIVVAISNGMFLLALGLVALNRFLDGLDGTVARARREASDFGGYADIVADFTFYASIPVAFTLYSPTENALPSTLLLASFIGTSSSFLAYAIVAKARKLSTEARGKKSFYHLGGLIEGTESILFVVIVCLVPEYYAPITYIFAGLCGLSTVGRVMIAYQDFGTKGVEKND